jgi:MFS family permease
LLVFGPVSDYLGRRRVILVGLAMAAGACVLFLAADGVGLLFAAPLLAGTAVTLAAIQTASAPVLLAGTAVAGAGFGTAMLGTFRTITALAAPGQRAGLIAAYYIASYTAFGVPVVIAGVAVTHVGLHRTALVYCAVTAALAALAAAGLIIRRAGGAAQPGEREMP